MAAIITLTTDFGLSDAYVAAIKGVILGINPAATLVDICHTIRPQDVAQAAFVVGTSYRFFPRETVHLVVVDPGVGTQRRAVILRTPEGYFVAPDNGVLSYVLERTVSLPGTPHLVELEAGMRAVSITRPQFWRSPVSPTFHGRDIFAPVAAHLSRGVSLEAFGEAITSLHVLPVSRPELAPDGSLVGHVRHIDGFGNLITDIRQEDLPPETQHLDIRLGEHLIRGLSHTYGSAEGLLALIGGSDHLEVSLRDGNASAATGSGIGAEVRVSPHGS